ncbi:hypothetical protein ACJMK2_014237 [Sinanodonta woodiana]|uniref:DnaJ homolog subfamily C member 22 n=1 Tax=Sinanodonta woodiana TaxID=1069815 RepID=A0ABD3V010_SINWO
MANIVVTFILWLVGGWFGLHHFYLGRDKHAFIWWSTLGGICGLGWIRDLWRLSEYVCEANNDPRYHEEFRVRRKYSSSPSCRFIRIAGEMVVGLLYGHLARVTLPEEIVTKSIFGYSLAIILTLLASVIGVHLVANIGREKAHIKWSLYGALFALPILWYRSESVGYAVILPTIFVNWKGLEWRAEKPRQGLCKRITALGLCGMIYLSMWGSAIYFNASVTRNGETIPVREAINHFFNSPAWAETKETFWKLYDYYKVHGWSKMWEQIVESLDPTGEGHAYNVLELQPNASLDEIKKQCKTLALKWHPDKIPTEEEKLKAKDKFIEIRNACEILKKRYKMQERRKEDRKSKSDKPNASHNHAEF